jgi:hypothetical protein
MVTIEYAASLINPNLDLVVEFGVGSGHTMRQCTNILKTRFPGKSFKVRGFDWFKGLPEAWVYTRDPNIVAAPQGAFSQNGLIPNIEGVEYYVGLFEDTLPAFVEKEAEPLALVHIDCDLYSSTKTVLESIRPYLVKDTIIAFDEWYYLHNSTYDDHEAKAFLEFVDKYQIAYEFVDWVCTEKPAERKIVRIL